MQSCSFERGSSKRDFRIHLGSAIRVNLRALARIFRIGRAAHFEHMSMHVLNVVHLTHILISIHMHMFTNSILDVMNVMSVVCERNE